MSAILSEDGVYRYRLDRGDPDDLHCLFVMLNPSTADSEMDDPTIRKCRGFASRWNYDAFTVVNLYAYRATKPADLWQAEKNGIDIVGPENDHTINDALFEQEHADGLVVAAWGNHAKPLRVKEFSNKRWAHDLQCLGKNKNGSPKHPLMVPYEITLDWWS